MTMYFLSMQFADGKRQWHEVSGYVPYYSTCWPKWKKISIRTS